jgi:hypothetical protein
VIEMHERQAPEGADLGVAMEPDDLDHGETVKG